MYFSTKKSENRNSRKNKRTKIKGTMGMYLKIFLVELSIIAVCAGPVWGGAVAVQQRDSSVETAQVEMKPASPKFKQVEPAEQLKFERYEHGDVKMYLPILQIKYDEHSIVINQDQEKHLFIQKDSHLSHLLDSDGKFSVTVEYRIKNNTTKRLKFLIGVRHGNNVIAQKEVTFSGEQKLIIQQDAKLTTSSGYLPIIIEGLNILDYPDDTRPVFFKGSLWFRVY